MYLLTYSISCLKIFCVFTVLCCFWNLILFCYCQNTHTHVHATHIHQFLEIFELIECPSMQPILVNIPCAPENYVYSSVWVWYSINTISCILFFVQIFSILIEFLVYFIHQLFERVVKISIPSCRLVIFFLQICQFLLHIFQSSTVRWHTHLHVVFLIN